MIKVLLIYSLIVLSGFFYIFTRSFYRPDTELLRDKKQESSLKAMIEVFNHIADRIGRYFITGWMKKKLFVRRWVLEILEHEKDIRITVSAYLGYKIIISILLLVAGALLGSGIVYRLTFIILGAAAGYFIPDIMMKRYSQRLSDDTEKELSYVIDLLRISALSGQNIYNSFSMLTEKYNGRICSGLKNFIRDIDMGAGKDYAYHNLILGSRSPQFREFITVIREAEKYGSPVDDILSRRSIQINHENWDNAERKAKKIGILTLLPLVFLILPAFILLVGGPLVFSLASGLFP